MGSWTDFWYVPSLFWWTAAFFELTIPRVAPCAHCMCSNLWKYFGQFDCVSFLHFSSLFKSTPCSTKGEVSWYKVFLEQCDLCFFKKSCFVLLFINITSVKWYYINTTGTTTVRRAMKGKHVAPGPLVLIHDAKDMFWGEELSVLLQDRSSVPSTHVRCNSVFCALFWPPWVPELVHIHTQTQMCRHILLWTKKYIL